MGIHPIGFATKDAAATRDFSAADKRAALELLADANPTAASGLAGRKLYKAADYHAR